MDTDISSYIIKRRPATLVEKFKTHAETLNVSVMTAAELRFGAQKAARPQLATNTWSASKPSPWKRAGRTWRC